MSTILLMRLWVCARTCRLGVCMYIIMSVVVEVTLKVFISVKNAAKIATFLRKDLVEWKIVSTFALAFEKYSFLLATKERVL